MEVFIAFCPDDDVMILEQTLVAWGECDGAEPVALQIKRGNKYELERRITADSLAKGPYYILAELGCVPDSNDLVRVISRKMKAEDGLVGLWPADSTVLEVPSGVCICRKGIIRHWIPKRTVTYNEEHAESVRRTGKTVELWADTFYKHLQAC